MKTAQDIKSHAKTMKTRGAYVFTHARGVQFYPLNLHPYAGQGEQHTALEEVIGQLFEVLATTEELAIGMTASEIRKKLERLSF